MFSYNNYYSPMEEMATARLRAMQTASGVSPTTGGMLPVPISKPALQDAPAAAPPASNNYYVWAQPNTSGTGEGGLGPSLPQWVPVNQVDSGGWVPLNNTPSYGPPSGGTAVKFLGPVMDSKLGISGSVFQDTATGQYINNSGQAITNASPAQVQSSLQGAAIAAQQSDAAQAKQIGSPAHLAEIAALAIGGAGAMGYLGAPAAASGVAAPVAGTTAGVGGADLGLTSGANLGGIGLTAGSTGLVPAGVASGAADLGSGLSSTLAGAGLAGGSSAATGLSLPASLGGSAIGLGLDSSLAGAGLSAGLSGLSSTGADIASNLAPVASGLTPAGVAAGVTDASIAPLADVAGTIPGTVGAGIGATGLGTLGNALGKATGSSVGSGVVPGGSSGTNLGGLAGISALIPGLAMIGSVAAGKKGADTSNLSGIADTLKTDAASNKPDTSALSALAAKLSGPGTTQDLLTRQANSLIPSVSTGILPAGAQTLIHNALSDATNSIKSKYAQLGLTGSTMENQELAQANANAQGQAFNFGNQLTNTGIAEAGAATSDINSAANIQSQIINSGLAASGLSASELGASATIYDEIMKTQVAQDTALQQALANFASASAIGVGLAAGGGGAPANGIVSSLSGLGTGFSNLLGSIGSGVSNLFSPAIP